MVIVLGSIAVVVGTFLIFAADGDEPFVALGGATLLALGVMALVWRAVTYALWRSRRPVDDTDVVSSA